jgi:hypothetical protein
MFLLKNIYVIEDFIVINPGYIESDAVGYNADTESAC